MSLSDSHPESAVELIIEWFSGSINYDICNVHEGCLILSDNVHHPDVLWDLMTLLHVVVISGENQMGRRSCKCHFPGVFTIHTKGIPLILPYWLTVFSLNIIQCLLLCMKMPQDQLFLKYSNQLVWHNVLSGTPILHDFLYCCCHMFGWFDLRYRGVPNKVVGWVYTQIW